MYNMICCAKVSVSNFNVEESENCHWRTSGQFRWIYGNVTLCRPI